MKKFIIILMTICCANALWAQDIITLKSGEEIKALVQKVGVSEVEYKKFENPNGPTYTLLKSNIFMIKYENGEKDVFTADTPQPVNTDVNAATYKGALTYKGSWWAGYTIKDSRGKELKKDEIRTILSNEPVALSAYNSGKTLRVMGTIVSIGGATCSLIGFLSTDFSKGGSISPWIWVGLGLTTASIVLDLSGLSSIKSAVNTYNNAQHKQLATTSLSFGLTRSGGIGFSLNF